jgi:hypothetical protein
MTYGAAALRGALSGALVGLLVGWLFGVFDWFNPVVVSGWLALLGALAGLLGHALSGGRRDFASVGAVKADRYEVQVDEEVAGEAGRLLAEMKEPAQAGSTSP